MGLDRVELNRAALRQLLRSAGVRADLERRARTIAAAAGSGHRVDSGEGTNRARAAVITATRAARYGEATRRTLTRAIDAGR